MEFLKKSSGNWLRPYFLIFLVADSILAYMDLPWWSKLMVLLAGILIPLIVALLNEAGLESESRPEIFDDNRRFIPWWVLLILLGIGVRIYGIFHWPVWPMWDDAYSNFFSVQQMEKWSWRLSVTTECGPPLFFWIQALYYKLFVPSEWTMWFFAFLMSVFSLLAGVWAASLSFKGLSGLFLAFVLSLSFWPLFMELFSTPVNFFPFWEFAVIGLLFVFLRSKGKKNENFWALALGLAAALGLYLWVVALAPVVLLGLFLFWRSLWKRETKWTVLPWFLVPLVILDLPEIPLVFENIFRGHVADYLAPLSKNASVLERLRIALSYPSALLWGTLDHAYFNFDPLWGGYLNPILGAFFLIGWVSLFAKDRETFIWTVIFFATCMAPALMSNTIECMRILALLPFCLWLAAYGFRALGPVRGSWGWVLIALLAASLSLDLYHLDGPYHEWAIPHSGMGGSKSPENYRAFQILKGIKEKEGPGLVFSDFYYDPFDQSLYITTYDFNPVINPRLDPDQCRWAAVVLAPGEKRELLTLFPNSVFYDLSAQFKDDREMILATFDIERKDLGRLKSWIKIHREVQDLYPLYPFHQKKPDYSSLLVRLKALEKESEVDLFVRECLLEKWVYVERDASDPMKEKEFASLKVSAECFSPRLYRPVAIYFHELAVTAMKVNDEKRAWTMMKEAARFDPNYPLTQYHEQMRRLFQLKGSAKHDS